jgi:glycosyltransferase involved in cell wall biosynthesis
MSRPKYSVIVPVYNRPQEVDELLESLTLQTVKNFEVIIVEDGSSVRCEDVVDRYRDHLAIHYFFKPNTGPGPSRNFGYAHAQGDYFVVFDSDCILPPAYFEAVERSLQEHAWDAWGGPDTAHEKFTVVQRAMGYTMSSVFTTGGIRGGKKRVGWFQPRSFNMGISRGVYTATQGFRFDRYAEDIEFSIRMKKGGFKVGLIPEAYVYHKRRTTFSQFYDQVFNFGLGRARVGNEHPEEIKLTHWVPAFFVLGTCLIPFLLLISVSFFSLAVICWVTYFLVIFIDSAKVNKNLLVAMLSVPSAFLQLWGYGSGFLKERFAPTQKGGSIKSH